MADTIFRTVLPDLKAVDNGDGTYSVAVVILGMPPLTGLTAGELLVATTATTAAWQSTGVVLNAPDISGVVTAAAPLTLPSLTLSGNVLITTVNGIDVNPGADVNADLITVGVTGAPKAYWDEASDVFRFTKRINSDAHIGAAFNLYAGIDYGAVVGTLGVSVRANGASLPIDIPVTAGAAIHRVRLQIDTNDIFYVQATGDGAGGVTTLKAVLEHSLFIKEIAAAIADVAAYGQLWVKNTTPCELWFTDDVGTDTQIV